MRLPAPLSPCEGRRFATTSQPLQPPSALPAPTILEFARGFLGFHPDPVQASILETESKRVILNCTRQWGKSTIVALRAVWHALTQPGSLVLTVSPSERQSGELLAKARRFLRGLPIRRDPGVRSSIVLPNGSRLLGLAAVDDTIRCFSVSMLILDEAARIPDDVYDAVLPMLAATNGSLWLVSTPAGQRGFFWEEWMRGDSWLRVSVPATECPRISPEFLDEMHRKRGRDRFRQEYLCQFHSADDRLFDRDDLDSLLALDVPALKRSASRDQPAAFPFQALSLNTPSSGPRHFYIGLDLGKLADYSAVAVVERILSKDGLDRVSFRPVFRHRHVLRHLERIRLGTAYPRVVARVGEIIEQLALHGCVTLAVDATGLGEPVVDSLKLAGLNAALMPIVLTGADHTTKPNSTWHVPKKDLLIGLQGMVARRDLELARDLECRDDLIEEMVNMGRSLKAPRGLHDDLVIAVALAAWPVRSRRPVGEKTDPVI